MTYSPSKAWHTALAPTNLSPNNNPADSAPPRARLYIGSISALYRLYIGPISTLYRLYIESISALYRLYIESISALYRLCTTRIRLCRTELWYDVTSAPHRLGIALYRAAESILVVWPRVLAPPNLRRGVPPSPRTTRLMPNAVIVAPTNLLLTALGSWHRFCFRFGPKGVASNRIEA